MTIRLCLMARPELTHSGVLISIRTSVPDVTPRGLPSPGVSFNKGELVRRGCSSSVEPRAP